jgi:hypothetical protein
MPAQIADAITLEAVAAGRRSALGVENAGDLLIGVQN